VGLPWSDGQDCRRSAPFRPTASLFVAAAHGLQFPPPFVAAPRISTPSNHTTDALRNASPLLPFGTAA